MSRPPCLLLPLVLALSMFAQAADDWKLLPLPYNNPDITVDLGVGLWAWPMPMDYDGDGVKNAAFTQHQQPFYGPRSNWKAIGRSVRTTRWRYTEWQAIKTAKVIARELYDHGNDPGETNNLANHVPLSETVAALSVRLNQQNSR